MLKLLIIFCTITLAWWATHSTSALESKSFELTTKITEVLSTTQHLIHQVNEKYSSDQRRAKLQVTSLYKTAQGNQTDTVNIQSGTYHVDILKDLVLSVGQGKCQLSSLDEISKRLAFLSMDGLRVQTNETRLAGPAQLLMLISKNRHKLEQSLQTTMRNMQLTQFTFRLSPDALYLVFYLRTDDLDDPETNPIQIVYYSQKSLVIFDFSPLKVLQADTFGWTSRGQTGTTQVMLDEFAFPHLSGCSEIVGSQGEDFSFDGPSDPINDPPVRFSFVAKVTQTLTGRRSRQTTNYKSTLAYDGSLHSLRVDTLESASRSSPERSIYNFKTNKAYYLSADHQTDKSSECVIGKVSGSSNVEVKIGLSDLLIGAKGFLFHLGRAQVRGISAYMYEAAGAELPFWLEPAPADEDDKWPQDRNNSTTTNTILYYFAQTDADNPLLMMDIYEHHKDDPRRVLRHQRIEILHFKWAVESVAPSNGDRASEMFSLRDLCADSQSSSSQVELILTQATQELPQVASSWLPEANSRDQATLSGLQETMQVSPANIFDLETRILKSKDQKETSLFVKFRHAPHPLKVKKVAYMGRGEAKLHPGSKSVDMFSVHSFQDCFYVAARKYNKIYIAFDPIDRLCLIDPQPSDQNPSTFVLGQQNRLEIFKLYSDFSPIGEFLASWTQDHRWSDRIRLQGMLIQLSFSEPKKDGALFRILRVQVSNNNVRPPVDEKHSDFERPLNEIRGFGLSLDDFEHNKQIELLEINSQVSKLDGQNDTSGQGAPDVQMSSNHCHARCLTDPECQSYSTCVFNYQLQCIISKLSFRSPMMVHELNRSKSGRRVSVTVRETQGNKTHSTQLIRHAACTLYNKQYLELFKSSSRKPEIRASKVNIEAVRSRDECAARCALQNFRLFGQFPQLFDEELAQNQSRDENITRMKMIQTIREQMCPDFVYMTSVEVMNLPQEVRAKLVSSQSKDDDIDGYCIIIKKASDFIEDVKVDYFIEATSSYTFELANLYDETRGVALVASTLEPHETVALERVRYNVNPSDEQVDLISSIVRSGENSQVYANSVDRYACARLCFMQTVNPWPACRSFDVIIERFNEQSVVRCRLNSVTLMQLTASGRYHLIENQTKIDRQFWHYEPRFGLMLAMMTEPSESTLAGQSGAKSGGLKALLVVLLALASGIWSGMLAHRRYLSGFRLRLTNGRSNSVDGLILGNKESTRETVEPN